MPAGRPAGIFISAQCLEAALRGGDVRRVTRGRRNAHELRERAPRFLAIAALCGEKAEVVERVVLTAIDRERLAPRLLRARHVSFADEHDAERVQRERQPWIQLQ